MQCTRIVYLCLADVCIKMSKGDSRQTDMRVLASRQYVEGAALHCLLPYRSPLYESWICRRSCTTMSAYPTLAPYMASVCLASCQYVEGAALQCLPTLPSHIWALSAWGQEVPHYYWVPLDGKCIHFSLWTYSKWTTIKGFFSCLFQGEGVPKKDWTCTAQYRSELKITAVSDGSGAPAMPRSWPSNDLISRLDLTSRLDLIFRLDLIYRLYLISRLDLISQLDLISRLELDK